jgi:hypothetical protein
MILLILEDKVPADCLLLHRVAGRRNLGPSRKVISNHRQPLCAVAGCYQKQSRKETMMNKSNFAALGLTLTVALSTGGLLLKHPVPTGSNLAPGAYSDILIAEDATPREAPAGEKSATPTDIPGSSKNG